MTKKKYLREPVPSDLECFVRPVRKVAGWDLRALARKAGTTEQTLRRIELNQHPPSFPVALRLSAILDVPVQSLWTVPSYEALRPSTTSASATVSMCAPGDK